MLTAAFAAVLAAGCGTGAGLDPASPTPGAGRPVTTAATTGASCPNAEGGGCLGPLEPGVRYTTSRFQPALTYTVPDDGWGNYEDLTGNFLLVPPGNSLNGVNAGTSDFLGVYRSVAPSEFVALPACAARPVPGVAATPEAMAGWLAGRAELTVTPPTPVTVGSLSGLVLDVSVARGAAIPTCVDGGVEVTVALLFSGVTPSSLDHGVIFGLAMRLYLLTYADGILAVEVDDIASAPGTLDDYAAVVEGLAFNG